MNQASYTIEMQQRIIATLAQKLWPEHWCHLVKVAAIMVAEEMKSEGKTPEVPFDLQLTITVHIHNEKKS